MNDRPRRRPEAFVLCLFFLVLCARPGAGQDESSYVRSYTPNKVNIKGGATAQGLLITLVDKDFGGILAAPGYAAVDVVMNQCHSGGFLFALTNSKPAADWTGASACTDEGTSRYLYALVPPDTKGAVDDFARAWREDALRNPPTGMKQHFLTASNGNASPKILPDRWCPSVQVIHQIVIPGLQIGNYIDPASGEPRFGPKPGTEGNYSYDVVYGTKNAILGWWVSVWDPNANMFGWVQITPKPGPDPGGKWTMNGKDYAYSASHPLDTEFPQYASAGPDSDNRTLALPNPNDDNIQQYAILVQWDRPQDHNGKKTATFAAGISRMYNMLINAPYNVPPTNIAVLYYDGTYDGGNKSLPAFTLEPGVNGAKTEDLPAVPINAPTGVDAGGMQEFADDAVKGKLFGAVPTFAKSRLLVYFTGHGGRAKLKKMGVSYAPDPNLIVTLLSDFTTDPSQNPALYGYDAAAEFEQNMLSSLATTNSVDLSDAGILYNTNNILCDTNNVCSVQDSQTLIQISTTQPIPYGVQLVVNDYTNLGTLFPVSDPNATVYDLEPFVPGLLTNTYTYQVFVPNLALFNPLTNGENPAVIGLQFQGLPATNFEPGFVAAVIVLGASEELAYTPPDFTTTSQFSAQPFGGGILVTWPLAATNYNILENDDLTTTNWVKVIGPTTGTPEVTGVADPALPMGVNWAFFSYIGASRFFKLAPAP